MALLRRAPLISAADRRGTPRARRSCLTYSWTKRPRARRRVPHTHEQMAHRGGRPLTHRQAKHGAQFLDRQALRSHTHAHAAPRTTAFRPRTLYYRRPLAGIRPPPQRAGLRPRTTIHTQHTKLIPPHLTARVQHTHREGTSARPAQRC